MRAWKLPQWSFSIWDGCGQHRMIPVVQTCPLSHVVHVHFFVVFLVFGRLWPCLVVFLWQVCCVWLYDRTIGVFGVLLWPKAVLVVVRLRWWLALLIYLLYGLCKKFSGSFWKMSPQMLLFFFWTRLSGSSFQGPASASVCQHWHNQACIESYLCRRFDVVVAPYLLQSCYRWCCQVYPCAYFLWGVALWGNDRPEVFEWFFFFEVFSIH